MEAAVLGVTHLMRSALLPLRPSVSGTIGPRWRMPAAGGSRWARSQQGNSGLSRLTAAAGSRGSSGSYRGRAHPEGQPAGHLCPLTSVLASLQEGEGKQ